MSTCWRDSLGDFLYHWPMNDMQNSNYGFFLFEHAVPLGTLPGSDPQRLHTRIIKILTTPWSLYFVDLTWNGLSMQTEKACVWNVFKEESTLAIRQNTFVMYYKLNKFSGRQLKVSLLISPTPAVWEEVAQNHTQFIHMYEYIACASKRKEAVGHFILSCLSNRVALLSKENITTE